MIVQAYRLVPPGLSVGLQLDNVLFIRLMMPLNAPSCGTEALTAVPSFSFLFLPGTLLTSGEDGAESLWGGGPVGDVARCLAICERGEIKTLTMFLYPGRQGGDPAGCTKEGAQRSAFGGACGEPISATFSRPRQSCIW